MDPELFNALILSGRRRTGKQVDGSLLALAPILRECEIKRVVGVENASNVFKTYAATVPSKVSFPKGKVEYPKPPAPIQTANVPKSTVDMQAELNGSFAGLAKDNPSKLTKHAVTGDIFVVIELRSVFGGVRIGKCFFHLSEAAEPTAAKGAINVLTRFEPLAQVGRSYIGVVIQAQYEPLVEASKGSPPRPVECDSGPLVQSPVDNVVATLSKKFHIATMKLLEVVPVLCDGRIDTFKITKVVRTVDRPSGVAPPPPPPTRAGDALGAMRHRRNRAESKNVASASQGPSDEHDGGGDLEETEYNVLAVPDNDWISFELGRIMEMHGDDGSFLTDVKQAKRIDKLHDEAINRLSTEPMPSNDDAVDVAMHTVVSWQQYFASLGVEDYNFLVALVSQAPFVYFGCTSQLHPDLSFYMFTLPRSLSFSTCISLSIFHINRLSFLCPFPCH
jgi:hypothetical protein